MKEITINRFLSALVKVDFFEGKQILDINQIETNHYILTLDDGRNVTVLKTKNGDWYIPA